MDDHREFKHFTDVLAARAAVKPSEIAVRLLGQDDSALILTYAELERKARAVAAGLQKAMGSRVKKGERALLLYDCSLDYVTALLGCFYAGIIAVPAYPPVPGRLKRMLPRLFSLVDNCSPKLILTTSDHLNSLKLLILRKPSLLAKKWIATDKFPDSLSTQYRPVPRSRDDIAFLQYTSGSTGVPKGVMVTHGNLLHNCEAIRLTTGMVPGSHMATWLPLYHDMGLIGTVLAPIYSGIPTTIFPSISFIRQPLRWLKMISDYRATHSGGPNFAFELCAHKISEEEKKSLDLSSWNLAFCGAEPIRPSVLRDFCSAFAPCGFQPEAMLPTYGLAEATLMVAAERGIREKRPLQVQGQARNLVSCGAKVAPDLDIRIVNPSTLIECSPGETGEIWICGPSVAAGYWKRKEESERIFRAKIASSITDPGTAPSFLRTGDLGFLEGDRLHINGRLKDVILVNGCNHYPADIEATVASAHAAIRKGCSAAFGVEAERAERLVVVAELRSADHSQESREEIASSIRSAVHQALTLSVSEIVFIRKGTLPKTTSGKICRLETKNDYLQRRLKYVFKQPQLHAAVKNTEKSNDRELPAAPRKDGSVDTKNWLLNRLAQTLGVESSQVDPSKSFAELGIDSVRAIGLAEEISRYFGHDFSPTLFWQFTTVTALAAHLSGVPVVRKQTPTARITSSPNDAIAIVGMSGVFPGAADLNEFWKNLLSDDDKLRKAPEDRWNWADYPDAVQACRGNGWFRRGGFIDDIDKFDAAFFGISPREAQTMDPQHRLFLQTARAAIEDSGRAPSSLAGTRTGVFVGASSSDYLELLTRSGCRDFYVATGNSHSILSNRFSFLFDLRGPSKTIDTACSSSLVAVHDAVGALRRAECEIAIVGGVNAILSPLPTYLFSTAGMLSPEGKCKTFDAQANGYVRGEGCGVVVLKPLADATRDGDFVYAVIRGSTVAHGGRTSSLTAPSAESQASLLVDALRSAHVPPRAVSFIEAHGTGTSLGDPIELEGIRKALESDVEYPSPNRCAIGALKTHIGHLEAAAGIAGLIKTALCLYHRRLPANQNLLAPNPYLRLEDSPFYLLRETQKWERTRDGKGNDLPLTAGVSSFGFGGTNAHVVLQESEHEPVSFGCVTPSENLFVFSAKSRQSLNRYLDKFRGFLSENPDICLSDIAHTLQVGRDFFAHRVAILANTRSTLLERLALVLRQEYPNGVFQSQVSGGSGLETSPEDSAYCQDLVRNGRWEKLAALWVAGFPVKFSGYPGARRIPLPSYAFDKKAYWVPGITDAARPSQKDSIIVDRPCSPLPSESVTLHPLIDRQIESANGITFEKHFRNTEFFLKEHIIQGVSILPGVAYLEIARQLGEIVGQGKPVHALSDITWTKPLVVGEKGKRATYRILPHADYLVFEITDGEAICCRGRIHLGESHPHFSGIDSKDALSEQSDYWSDRWNANQIYSRFRELGFYYGASFQAMRRLHIGRFRALSELELKQEWRDTRFGLPPSLLDAALGTCLGIEALSQNDDNQTYVPYALERLNILGPIPAEGLALATLRTQSDSRKDGKKYDVTLSDPEGRPLLQFLGAVVRGLPSGAVVATTKIPCARESWVPRSLSMQSAETSLACLIFSDAWPTRDILSVNGLILTESASAMDFDDTGSTAAIRNLYEFFSRWRETSGQPIRVLYIFRKSSSRPHAAQSALAAFGRSLTTVAPEFSFATLETETPLPRSLCVEEIQSDSFKNGNEIRYNSRLERFSRDFSELVLQPAPAGQSLPKEKSLLKTRGNYLVTGALGGIGRVICRDLATRFQARLILVGRRPQDAEISAWVHELALLGADAAYVRVDIADLPDLERAARQWSASHGPLDGVFHLAGIAPATPITETNWREFEDILSPKVRGTENLDHVTRLEPLDFFVLFSSISAILGDFGAVSYATANRFQDAFAEWRAQRAHEGDRSGKSISINWPLWKEGGMQLPPRFRHLYGDRTGLSPIESGIGLQILYALLEQEGPRFLVGFVPPPEKSVRLSLSSIDGATELDRARAGSSDAETEAFLRVTLAAVLKLPADTIDRTAEFTEYGADSIALIEWHSQLQERFGSTLTATTFFEYPSLALLARYLESGVDLPKETGVSEKGCIGAMREISADLSHAQSALWYLYQSDPQSSAYNIPLALRFSGELDTERLEQAVIRLMEHQQSLSARFVDGTEASRQVFAVRAPEFKVVSISDLEESTPLEFMKRDNQRPFDLRKGPLLRVQVIRDSTHGDWLFLNTHHIVCDGFSCVLMLKQLLGFYRGETLPPLKRTYLDFVQVQADSVRRGDWDNQWTYWKQKLSGTSGILDLPFDRPRPTIQTYKGNTVTVSLDRKIADAIKDLARLGKTTPFCVLFAAFNVLLHRYSDQVDIVVGSPVFGRTIPGYEETIGYFVNMLALRTQLDPKEAFQTLLGKISRTVREALAHQDFPFPLLVEKLEITRMPDRSPIFQVAFVFQGTLADHTELTVEHGCKAIHIPQQEGQFDIELEIFGGDTGFNLHFKYNTDLFNESTIHRLSRHYTRLLQSVVANSHSAISDLDMLEDEERQRLIQAFNATDNHWPNLDCLPYLFEQQAEAVADNPALTFEGQTLSYAQMNTKVNRLAHYLIEQGVGPDKIVGLMAERSPEMIIAIHAILKAGGAYLPLEPDLPAARLELMLQDARPTLVLAQDRFLSRVPGNFKTQRLQLTDRLLEAYRETNPQRRACLENLAYIIYTSGSTGAPKGVLIEHGAIANRILWMQREYPLGAGDCVLQKTPFSFDVSVWEFLWPFITGARLVVARPELHADITYLRRLIQKENITALHFVPSVLQVFLEMVDEAECTSIRDVFCSGEVLPLDLQTRFFQRLPGKALHNLYGPTEAAVDVSYWRCRKEPDSRSVPIGKPIANTRLYILDRYDNPTPIGIPGDLCIAGAGLARGYLNRTELTQEKFQTNPFAGPGYQRIYRSGDICRYRPDGAIEYLSRRDTQVKLRGQRLELGEIETVISNHPRVTQAVVQVIGERADEKRLVAYYTTPAGAPLTRAELSEFVQVRLPAFMVPSAFMAVESFPISANGKLNRLALPAPETFEIDDITAQATPLEERVAQLFAEVLGRKTAGIDEDFFEAGGTSLRSITLVETLRLRIGSDLTVRDLFEQRTARRLARIIGGKARSTNGLDTDWSDEARRLADGLPASISASVGESDPPARILLTGATGFLGAFLLRDLLCATDAQIFCLIRAADETQARARVRSNLEQYGIWREDYGPRIVPVVGDICRPRLGLEVRAYEDLCQSVDTVYHNAASVHFLEPYAGLKPVNVIGTLEVIRFAASGRVKRLHYISTISVFASTTYRREDRVLESSIPHSSGLYSGYAQSKWVAERLVANARERGLPCRVYRPGTLCGTQLNGVQSSAELLGKIILGCLSVGAMPSINRCVEMTPVDTASRLIVALSLDSESRHDTYHVANPTPISQDTFRHLFLELGYPMESVPLAAWCERIRRDPGNPLQPLLPLFTQSVTPDGLTEAELTERFPQIDTARLLVAIAGKETSYPPIDRDLLAANVGFLTAREKPPTPMQVTT